MSTLGNLIKKYRNTRNPKMSMDRFSEISGLSKSYISMLEANKDPRGNPIVPTLNTINKCASAMGMEFEDLFNQLDMDYLIRINSDEDEWENRKQVELSSSEFALIEVLRKANTNDAQIRRMASYFALLNGDGLDDVEKYIRLLANSGEYKNDK